MKNMAMVESNLVIYDGEAHILSLLRGYHRYIALAVPSNNNNDMLFISSGIREEEWTSYMQEERDLLSLFTNSADKEISYIYLNKMDEDGQVELIPAHDGIDPAHLPYPGFMASHHSEDYKPAHDSAELRARWDFNQVVLENFEICRVIGYAETGVDSYYILLGQGGREIWASAVGGYTRLHRLKGQTVFHGSNGQVYDDYIRLDNTLRLNGAPEAAEFILNIDHNDKEL